MHLHAREPSVEDGRPPQRLIDRVRYAIRVRRYSLRTERAYVHWIRRFIVFHGRRHPAEMGGAEVTAYLTHLAVEGHVAAATQAQALAAVLFLYKHVLEMELPWLAQVVRARTPRRLPTVLEKAEVRALLDAMRGEHGLMARLMYGTGMRISECVALRVKDVNLARRELVVRDGKGGKDRMTLLPASLAQPLAEAIERSRGVFADDRLAGRASPGRSPRMRCATPSRRTCSTTATTSAPSRSCSATRT